MKQLIDFYHSPRFRGMVPPLLLLILWWQATSQAWVSSLVLVPFGQLAQALLDEQIRQSLIEGLQSTFARLLMGSAIGMGGGLVLGIAMGLSHVCDRMLGPSFHAVRQVAILAWIPLLTAWFGNGDLCKIVFVAIAASKPMVMGTYEGIRSAPEPLVEVGRTLCLSRVKMLRQIILPAAAPSIVTAMQLSLIFSWFAAIGAEYVIGVMSGGIGSVVVSAQEHFRTDIVLLGVILISTVGIAMNILLRKIPRILFPWNQAR
jgi:sulfonate transport system permease protein